MQTWFYQLLKLKYKYTFKFDLVLKFCLTRFINTGISIVCI